MKTLAMLLAVSITVTTPAGENLNWPATTPQLNQTVVTPK